MHFAGLRTYKGQTHDTFKEAYAGRGLLDDDKILADAITHQMPQQLRHTFALRALCEKSMKLIYKWQRNLHAEKQVRKTCSQFSNCLD